MVAPWLAWGPYLWADGTAARSDGFTWLCSDLESDYTHPSATGGVVKVARQLLAFFKTDPTATPWFLRKTLTGQPPALTASANVSNGLAPLTVNFSASASDPDGTIRDYQWTFDDGTFAADANPGKIFNTPGVYAARVTVTDDSGNAVTRSVQVNVAAVALERAAFLSGGQLQCAVLGPTNYEFVVQRSEDLANWVSVVTNRGPFTFTDTNAIAPKRFYRASVQP